MMKVFIYTVCNGIKPGTENRNGDEDKRVDRKKEVLCFDLLRFFLYFTAEYDAV